VPLTFGDLQKGLLAVKGCLARDGPAKRIKVRRVEADGHEDFSKKFSEWVLPR